MSVPWPSTLWTTEAINVSRAFVGLEATVLVRNESSLCDLTARGGEVLEEDDDVS